MEVIGQLTGGIAHDFNNLLIAILSSLELLAKRLPDDPASHWLLNNAVEGAHRGATLMQRIAKGTGIGLGMVHGMTQADRWYVRDGQRANRNPLAADGNFGAHREGFTACTAGTPTQPTSL